MAEFPALPIFTDALLADTSHLTHEEFGAYMRILILMWRTPECRIPVADAWLMRKLMCDTNKFNDLFKPLFLEFMSSDGTYYHQKRLSKEFEYVRMMREKNRGAAKSRWNKEKNIDSGNAPSGNAPHPTPPHLPKEDIDRDSENFNKFEAHTMFEDFWSKYPSKICRADAITSYTQARKKGIDHATIIAGVERYSRQVQGKSSEHISNPSRWLDGERWNDEYREKPTQSHDPGNSSPKPTNYERALIAGMRG